MKLCLTQPVGEKSIKLVFFGVPEVTKMIESRRNVRRRNDIGTTIGKDEFVTADQFVKIAQQNACIAQHFLSQNE
jgi:hypothetical protein